jgi:hypothetical protein
MFVVLIPLHNYLVMCTSAYGNFRMWVLEISEFMQDYYLQVAKCMTKYYLVDFVTKFLHLRGD